MRSQNHFTVAMVIALLTPASNAFALRVGEITHFHPSTQMRLQQPSEWKKLQWVADEGVPLDKGAALKTETDGAVTVLLTDPRFATERRQFDMAESTEVAVVETIDPRRTRVDIVLERGSVRFIGEAVVVAGSKRVVATGTEFIVTYDPEAPAVQVTCLTGRVEVEDLAGGATVTVAAGHAARFNSGASAAELRVVDTQAMQAARVPFEFVCRGHGESLVLDDGVLRGEDVSGSERVPGWDDPTGHAPAGPGPSTPVDVTKEPPPSTDLGVRF